MENNVNIGYYSLEKVNTLGNSNYLLNYKGRPMAVIRCFGSPGNLVWRIFSISTGEQLHHISDCIKDSKTDLNKFFEYLTTLKPEEFMVTGKQYIVRYLSNELCYDYYCIDEQSGGHPTYLSAIGSAEFLTREQAHRVVKHYPKYIDNTKSYSQFEVLDLIELKVVERGVY